MRPMLPQKIGKDIGFGILLVVGCLCASLAHAQDRADIDKTKIIGNRELPKVLYIVPWKKPIPGDLAGRPLVSVLDEALSPIDRDVFQRQVNYEVQTRALETKKEAPVAPIPAVKK
jgi:hypothetical protein